MKTLSSQNYKVGILSIGISIQSIEQLKKYPVELCVIDDYAERLLFEKVKNKFLFDQNSIQFLETKVTTLFSNYDLIITLISTDAACWIDNFLPRLHLKFLDSGASVISVILQENNTDLDLLDELKKSSTVTFFIDNRFQRKMNLHGFESPLNLIGSFCNNILKIIYEEQTIDLHAKDLFSILKANPQSLKIGFKKIYLNSLSDSNVFLFNDIRDFSQYKEILVMLTAPNSPSEKVLKNTLCKFLKDFNPNSQLNWGIDRSKFKNHDFIRKPVIFFGIFKKVQAPTSILAKEKPNQVKLRDYSKNKTSSLYTQHRFQNNTHTRTKNIPLSNTPNFHTNESIYVFGEGGLTLAHFPGSRETTSSPPETVTGLFEALKVMAKDIVGQNLETVLAGSKKLMFKTKELSDGKKITGVSIFDRETEDISPINTRLDQSIDLIAYLFRQNVKESEMKGKVDELLAKSPLPLLFSFNDAS